MSDSNNLLPVVVGGLIGIAGGIASSICVQYFNRRAERLSLQNALVNEIVGLLSIVERRDYVAGLERLISIAESTPAPPHIPAAFYFSTRRNPFIVYDANLSRIGLLSKPIAGQIVKFYTMAAAILEDIADMREAAIPRTRADSIDNLKTLHKLFSDTVALGNQIIGTSQNGG